MAFHLWKWVLCFGGEVSAKVAKLIVDLPCSIQNCFLLFHTAFENTEGSNFDEIL